MGMFRNAGGAEPSSRHGQFGADDGTAVGAHEDAAAAGEGGYEIHPRSQQSGNIERLDLAAAAGADRRVFEGELRLAAAGRFPFLHDGPRENRVGRDCCLGRIGHPSQCRHGRRRTLADVIGRGRTRRSPCARESRDPEGRVWNRRLSGDQPRRGD